MALMKEWLYEFLVCIARIHDMIEDYSFSTRFDDKQLHFIIMGAFGLVVLLLCWLLFRELARRGRIGLMSWLLALFITISVCFAIEIGQYKSNTGAMEMEDIVYGIAGFLAVSALTAICVLLFKPGRKLLRRYRERKREA